MSSAVAKVLRGYVQKHGLIEGTRPENYAAMRLHRWGVDFRQQLKVGRYRLDFAAPDVKVAVEVDGPHHWRPDVAARDVARDAWLRQQGWLVLRVSADTDEMDEQLLRAVEVIHGLRGRS